MIFVNFQLNFVVALISNWNSPTQLLMVKKDNKLLRHVTNKPVSV